MVLKVLSRLEALGEEDESGSTVTAMFLAADSLWIAHVGDSSGVCNVLEVVANMTWFCTLSNFCSLKLIYSLWMKVLSRSGKAEVLTDPHRPYGSGKVSLAEIRRIREAGGWVCLFCPLFFVMSFGS